MDINKVYLGDCLEIMPSIPDKSIDTIPPYSFKQWIEREYKGQWEGDIAPELLYDGYVWSLRQLGYEVFGNCYNGITVKGLLDK